ncbi:GDSL esterase/lipase [Rhynchospora pubera]|uniref:GDSL esterase/lipase n=1 Tax=Rhynchospora pubera TaxID=906938 RepID=A0AAV8FZ43_9POAL|nr:GDSL esterase/lipase [Rhynchospora pubera]
MKSFSFQLLLILVSLISSPNHGVKAKCAFPAIFNFGDSNSDTGGFWAAFPAQHGPFGVTYFHRPAGRASDGRLVIDLLAQALGLPFVSPYLQSIGSDFRHGANFATLASTVLLPQTSLFVSGISPFSLGIQLNQMKELQARSLSLNQSGLPLPSPDNFAHALYTIDIGQNDFTSNLKSIGVAGVIRYLPSVVNQISWTVKELHDLGARNFIVFNLAPIGCYPAFLRQLPHNAWDVDLYGCMVSYNKAVEYYNKLLLRSLNKIRGIVPGANVVYFDKYAVLLGLFQHPKTHGFFYSTKACCGYGGGIHNYNPAVYCGNSKVIKGQNVTATACVDPQNYISWDGIHPTEAANKYVTWALLDGSRSRPTFNFSKFCDLQPIG